MSEEQKPIQKSIAKLLTVKKIVILIIVCAGVYFLSTGKMEMAVFTSLFTAVVSLVLNSND